MRWDCSFLMGEQSIMMFDFVKVLTIGSDTSGSHAT